MSCGVGRRHSSDLALLWLQCRLAALGPIGPLAWELPYAMGVALKSVKKKKKKEWMNFPHGRPGLFKKLWGGVPIVAQLVENLTSIKLAGSIPGLTQWV